MFPKYRCSRLLNGSLSVDDSGSASGYIFAGASCKTDHRLKLRISKDMHDETYDLKNDGSFEIFPLNLGDGNYQIKLYENTYGNRYADNGTVSIYVNLKNEDAPFLCPNQFVYYDENSEVVNISESICSGKSDEASFESVRNYIKQNFAYDFIKAATRKPGMVPDIDGTISKKMGICQDLSAVVVAMLRVQGIPSKLVFGHADNLYHAWTLNKINGRYTLFDPTVELYAANKPSKYTEERVF